MMPISIHAPHTGRDPSKFICCAYRLISIHAPHTGRDKATSNCGGQAHKFQSTRPIRGATPYFAAWAFRMRYFNPRAPYGARLGRGKCRRRGYQNFNSCAPYGARHLIGRYRAGSRRISIHAPHTGRDVLIFVLTGLDIDFNPRAPYGARQRLRKCTGSWQKFQSTRPIRGATRCYDPVRQRRHISIHAPHTGRDARKLWSRVSLTLFQSTRPIRGATMQDDLRLAVPAISIHAPHTGRDICAGYRSTSGLHFNPRAPYGARPVTASRLDSKALFQSTRPIRGATMRSMPGPPV